MEKQCFKECPACGNSNQRKVIRKVTSESESERFIALSERKYVGCMNGWNDLLPLNIRECKICSHIWYYAQPDQVSLSLMYDKGVPLTASAAPAIVSSYMKSEMKKLFIFAQRRYGVEHPRLLDFGSGRGLWSCAAVLAGFEVIAYEPSTVRSMSECQEKGFVQISDLNDIKGQRFHVFNVEQVLEHLSKPVEVLSALTDFCDDHSLFRITVPNVGRDRRKPGFWDGFPFDGKQIHLMSPFEHVQGYAQSSLSSVVKRVGLRPLCGLDVWRVFPSYAFRRLLGVAIPPLSTTALIAEYKI